MTEKERKTVMEKKLYSKDIILVLAASFFYMSSPMLVTPLITGFTESIGASAAVMGFVGGLMNLCSLFCRPLAGNLADRISKYKLTFIGAVLMTIASAGYILAPNEMTVVISRIINGAGFACAPSVSPPGCQTCFPRRKSAPGWAFTGQ